MVVFVKVEPIQRSEATPCDAEGKVLSTHAGEVTRQRLALLANVRDGGALPKAAAYRRTQCEQASSGDPRRIDKAVVVGDIQAEPQGIRARHARREKRPYQGVADAPVIELRARAVHQPVSAQMPYTILAPGADAERKSIAIRFQGNDARDDDGQFSRSSQLGDFSGY